MAYELKKPYEEEARVEFIVEYNHNRGLLIQETEEALYALEANEIMVDGKPEVDPEYEEKQAAKERERIAKLSLTRGDVFRGLLKAKGVTKAQIRAIIEQLPEKTNEQSLTKELALIDFDDSLNFYRGVALIDIVGAQLGIASDKLDRFFETNNYEELLDDVEVEETEAEEVVEEPAEEAEVEE